MSYQFRKRGFEKREASAGTDERWTSSFVMSISRPQSGLDRVYWTPFPWCRRQTADKIYNEKFYKTLLIRNETENAFLDFNTRIVLEQTCGALLEQGKREWQDKGLGEWFWAGRVVTFGFASRWNHSRDKKYFSIKTDNSNLRIAMIVK